MFILIVFVSCFLFKESLFQRCQFEISVEMVKSDGLNNIENL